MGLIETLCKGFCIGVAAIDVACIVGIASALEYADPWPHLHACVRDSDSIADDSWTLFLLRLASHMIHSRSTLLVKIVYIAVGAYGVFKSPVFAVIWTTVPAIVGVTTPIIGSVLVAVLSDAFTNSAKDCKQFLGYMLISFVRQVIVAGILLSATVCFVLKCFYDALVSLAGVVRH